MEWPVVVATWLDAETEFDTVNATEYVRTYRPCIRKTTGHLIGEDDTFIHLAMDDDRQNASTHNCQTVTTIPKVLLRRPLEKYHPPVKRKQKKR